MSNADRVSGRHAHNAGHEGVQLEESSTPLPRRCPGEHLRLAMAPPTSGWFGIPWPTQDLDRCPGPPGRHERPTGPDAASLLRRVLTGLRDDVALGGSQNLLTGQVDSRLVLTAAHRREPRTTNPQSVFANAPVGFSEHSQYASESRGDANRLEEIVNKAVGIGAWASIGDGATFDYRVDGCDMARLVVGDGAEDTVELLFNLTALRSFTEVATTAVREMEGEERKAVDR